ncbi:MAG: CYTH domain-containing protein [Oscillospiraceae bacterium]|nr:CYTH domain-containing protein [Oscillospiraceae bacterium]
MDDSIRRSVEREVKILLTQQQYEQIRGRFQWTAAVEQVNHYYLDREGQLRAEKVNLRVRQIGNRYWLQVKTLVKNVKGGPSVHQETETDIDGAPDFFDSRTVKALTGVETQGARRVGALTTLRHTLSVEPEIELCLDKSDYLGVTDYELEIEYTGDRLEAVLALVEQLGLTAGEKPQGKLSRFYARWRGLEKK